MNLQSLLRWAEKVLTVLDDPHLVAPSLCCVDRLTTKFAWLREYRKDVEVWSSWLALTDRALDLVRRNGYGASTADDVKQTLTEMSNTPEQELLKQELLEQESKIGARPEENSDRKTGRTLEAHNPTFSTGQRRPTYAEEKYSDRVPPHTPSTK